MNSPLDADAHLMRGPRDPRAHPTEVDKKNDASVSTETCD